MKRKGFTLSELMITMLVLGILLALVIPTIVNTRPDEHKMLTKKAYYVTERVVNSLINDELLYPDSTMNCPQVSDGDTCYYGFDDTNAVTYNGTTYGGSDSTDKKSKFPLLFAQQVNVKSLNCGGKVTDKAGQSVDNSKCMFMTTDGMTFDFTYSASYGKGPYASVWTQGVAPTSNKRIILVDVNGESSPNCLQTDTGCSHPDRFRIEIQSNGRMNVLADDSIAAQNITFDTKVTEN